MTARFQAMAIGAGRQGRYTHAPEYVRAAGDERDFFCVALEREALRHEAGGPVAGLIMVLERPRDDAEGGVAAIGIPSEQLNQAIDLDRAGETETRARPDAGSGQGFAGLGRTGRAPSQIVCARTVSSRPPMDAYHAALTLNPDHDQALLALACC